MDVMIFQLNDAHYAVPASCVREIVESLPVTPLPFAADEIDGLIHANGSVIPQFSAARRLMHDDPVDERARGTVMIMNVGSAVYACRVLKVIARIWIDPDSVSHTSADESDNGTSILTGEFFWNESLVLLLNPEQLVPNHLQQDRLTPDAPGLVSETWNMQEHALQAHHVDEFPCVLFICGGELFALRFKDVTEVVESTPLTPLPGSPAELAGVTLLRGEPVPVLSMHTLLFGVPGAEGSGTVIVRLHGFRVGLLVDRVVGIRRFACDSLRQLAEGKTLLEGFVTTGDNQLVALVRFDALGEPQRFSAWHPWLTAAAAETVRSDEQHRHSRAARRLLLFRQGSELMALPLEAVERIEEYCEPTVTPGDDNGSVCGVTQIQGQIMPVFPSARLSSGSDGAASVYLVVISGDKRCALPVEKVERLIDMEESAIEPVASSHNSYICAIGTCNGSLVSLIDCERLTL